MRGSRIFKGSPFGAGRIRFSEADFLAVLENGGVYLLRRAAGYRIPG
ncbi:hypothetical protein QMP26_27400 [Enterocloster clostridioformis]